MADIAAVRAAPAVLLLALAACAGTPEMDSRELEQVDLAVLEARQAGADEYAQRSLALAEERLALARKRLQEGREEAAADLLREAEVLAELAEAESAARHAERTLRVIEESLAALEREIGESDEPAVPEDR